MDFLGFCRRQVGTLQGESLKKTLKFIAVWLMGSITLWLRITKTALLYKRRGLLCKAKSSSGVLKHLGYFINKLFGLFPAKTGVGNRFSVNRIGTDFLRSVLNIALDHKALNNASYVL